MKSHKQHDDEVEQIRINLLHRIANKNFSPTTKTTTSNTTRNLNYTHWGKEIGIDKLDSVIAIDADKKIALVEPRVPMDKLAKAALAKGLMVPVIPEFKGITVGGAINGAALESSSHLHGQFNDVCTAYEVLLGDGSLVRASPQQNSDLFYGIAGSYGSLGQVVLAEIKLVPAKTWVGLKYHYFSSIKEAIACLRQLNSASNPPEFIEGIVFAKNNVVIIEGTFLTDKEAATIPHTLHLQYPWSPWYYQHVKARSQKKELLIEKIPLYDYLFRHDRGAFWMGSYGLHLPLLTRYCLENVFGMKKLGSHIFGNTSFEKFSKAKDPDLIFRTLLGWCMSSRVLYRMLHTNAEGWFADRFVVQDYYIPIEKVESFITSTIESMGIFPLWLCPIKPTQTPQIFSPHYLKESSLLVNVGVYGMPHKTCSLVDCNKSLERWTQAFKGRKMLYSHCYYTPEEFWSIYPKSDYERLRKQYHADLVWTSIEQKLIFCKK